MSATESLDIRQFIRDVPDFPQPGVLFRDITPLLLNQAAFRQALVGIESRGFLFGAPLAYRLGVPFVPIRKAGKLPAPVMSVEYSLEYGTSQLDIHKDALGPGQRVTIVDDVLATGGTAVAAADLVRLTGGTVQTMVFLAELSLLGGRNHLAQYDVRTLLTY
jgi:adenine phosphoribosyltransferase